MAEVEAATPELSKSRSSLDGVSPALPSPASSAESSFRELDDAFLQKQTRIWLGEVLQIRLDEQTDIADLLADGELLFEVSEVISRMTPSITVDATQPKVNEWKSVASSKSTRRYMPYYNVGAFLRMCKNLGMDSIDLFTPSDVVEKRNTRKVCICIRSLSKKVRSTEINVKNSKDQVPDFDSVTCTIAMPTDMVQHIRKSLERSQSSFAVEQDSEKAARIRYWQKTSNPASPISNGYSDYCDDADSGLMVSESQGSSDLTFDPASPMTPDPEMARDDEFAQNLQLNKDIQDDEDVEGEYLSPPESVGSHCSEYYSDQEPSSIQSSTLGSCIVAKVLELNGVENNGYRNVDVDRIPVDFANGSWDMQNYRDGNAGDDIDDSHGRQDRGKPDFNACPSLGDIHMENLTRLSNIEFQSSSYDNVEPVCCTNSIPLGNRKLGMPLEGAADDDLRAYEVPMSQSESFEDEQVASKDGFGKSVTYDLCNVEDDLYADDTPISKFKGLDEPRMAAEEGTFSNNSSAESVESHCDEKGREHNDNDHSSKSLSYSAYSIHAGENIAHEGLNDVKTTPKDVAGQINPNVNSCPCTVDSSEQSLYCSCSLPLNSNASEDHGLSPRVAMESQTLFQLLPDIDNIISADVDQSRTKNEKEAFDADEITSDHSEKTFDDNTMPVMDVTSSPSMIVAENGAKCADKISQTDDFVAQSFESKPIINTEDAQVGESVISNDKSTNTEHANSGNISTATLGISQKDAERFRTDDTSNKQQTQCEEAMQKVDPESIEGGDDSKAIQSHKPQRKLLKSVVKGTALVGIAVFLLHLRKNIKPNLPKEEKQQPAKPVAKNPAKPSSRKVQKAGSGNTRTLYPAEKLRFGI